MTIRTPEWVKHAIFYQIFPDRFFRSPRTKHPNGMQFKPWGSSPTEQGFQGGNLNGIVERLDYLQDLGVTAIYLNPIFASASNHRYHTYDYTQVDPLLGGNQALRQLLDAAHARNMHVVLDGVFNHASRGVWAFHHILENGANSPYIDWFTIHGFPLRPYASSPTAPANYAAWNNLPALPKFNTRNLAVREFIYQIARFWIEFGIDGWRLDVPEDIDSQGFWEEFRRVVKSANPEAYLVGEIWQAAQQWLQGDRFDAVMNYLFTSTALGFFGANTLRKDYHRCDLPLTPLDSPTFKARIDAMHALYDWEVNQSQLNLLDSHDTARALWIVGEDKSALRLAVLFQMTMPGAPCIYYGDEIGLSAGDDPHCRAAFPWEQTHTWDNDLLSFYRRAIHLRLVHPALRTGSFESLYAQDGIYAFQRQSPSETLIVAFNVNPSSAHVSLPLNRKDADETWTDLWNDKIYQVSSTGLNFSVPMRAASVLLRRPGN